jgi:hypothetical protein
MTGAVLGETTGMKTKTTRSRTPRVEQRWVPREGPSGGGAPSSLRNESRDYPMSINPGSAYVTEIQTVGHIRKRPKRLPARSERSERSVREAAGPASNVLLAQSRRETTSDDRSNRRRPVREVGR